MSLRRSQSGPADQQGGRPEGSDYRRARAALAGVESGLSPADAIEVIASSSFPNRHRDLERVLTEPRAPSRLRMLAASALARCDREAARAILVSAVAVDDPVVLVGVMRALGKVGDRAALEAIERAMPRLGGRARAQAEFARSLIVHRLGVTEVRLSPADTGERLEPPPDGGRRLHIRRASPSVAERCLTSLGPWPYGVEVDEQTVFQFWCERYRGAILVNRAYTGREALEVLRRRPALFGFEARRNEASGDYSVAAVVLTTPRGDGIDIATHLTNGERIFTGHAELGEEIARWSLGAVNRLGAFPFRASGTLAEGRLTIEIAESGARVVHRAQPAPLDVGPAARKKR